MLPDTSEAPLHVDTEEPTSAADGIPRFNLTDPSEVVTSIEIPQELAYNQLSSDEEPLGRDEPATVISDDADEARKGGSIESVSDGEIEDQRQQQEIEAGEQPNPTESLPETSGKSSMPREPRIVPITWDDTPTGSDSASQSKPRRAAAAPGNTISPTVSKETGHKGKFIQKRPPK